MLKDSLKVFIKNFPVSAQKNLSSLHITFYSTPAPLKVCKVTHSSFNFSD